MAVVGVTEVLVGWSDSVVTPVATPVTEPSPPFSTEQVPVKVEVWICAPEGWELPPHPAPTTANMPTTSPKHRRLAPPHPPHHSRINVRSILPQAVGAGLDAEAFMVDRGRCFRPVYDHNKQPARCPESVVTEGWFRDRSERCWHVDASQEHAEQVSPLGPTGFGTVESYP